MRRILIILAVAVLASGCWNLGPGTVTGLVYNLDCTGLVWQTPDITLIAATGNATIKWHGSVDTTQEGWEYRQQALETALREGKRVLVVYHTEMWAAPWRGAYRNIIDLVTVINESKS